MFLIKLSSFVYLWLLPFQKYNGSKLGQAHTFFFISGQILIVFCVLQIPFEIPCLYFQHIFDLALVVSVAGVFVIRSHTNIFLGNQLFVAMEIQILRSFPYFIKGAVVVVNVWQLDLQLPVQLVPITTKAVSLNPVHDKVYSIQYYVIKFVSDLRKIVGFLRVFQFPPQIILTATI